MAVSARRRLGLPAAWDAGVTAEEVAGAFMVCVALSGGRSGVVLGRGRGRGRRCGGGGEALWRGPAAAEGLHQLRLDVEGAVLEVDVEAPLRQRLRLGVEHDQLVAQALRVALLREPVAALGAGQRL